MAENSNAEQEMISLPKADVEILIGQNKELKADMYKIVDNFGQAFSLFSKEGGEKMGAMQLAMKLVNGGMSQMQEPINQIQAVVKKYDDHRRAQTGT